MDAAAHCRDLLLDGVAFKQLLFQEPVDRDAERHPGARDSRRARAAVRLDDVAVERDLALAQSFEVDHGAQGPADQTPDLLGAALLLAARRPDVPAGGRGAGAPSIFRRPPAAPVPAP